MIVGLVDVSGAVKRCVSGGVKKALSLVTVLPSTAPGVALSRNDGFGVLLSRICLLIRRSFPPAVWAQGRISPRINLRFERPNLTN